MQANEVFLEPLSDYLFHENIILKDRILEKISHLIDSKKYILGPELLNFEKKFATYCEVDHCVGVSSGTAALKLALQCLNLDKNDEIILPSHTFIATALAVKHSHCKIILCDINPSTFNIDLHDLEKKITPYTKAIIPVHLYGQMAEVEKIKNITNRNISIIEDASQAHGATREIDGILFKAGSFGDINCFSCYPTKNLGALGDAGIVTTNDESYSDQLKIIRNHGQSSRGQHTDLGHNEKMDEIQAIVLNEKLSMLDQHNSMRREVAHWYFEALQSLDLTLPITENLNVHTFHQFVIKVRNRKKIIQLFRDEGINLTIHYPQLIHQHECLNDLNIKTNKFPNAEKISQEILSLPMGPHLHKNDVDKVSTLLKQALEY